MTVIQVDVYECGHCAGPVKPNSARCEYCGYWFKEIPKTWDSPKIDEPAVKVAELIEYHLVLKIPILIPHDVYHYSPVIEMSINSPSQVLYSGTNYAIGYAMNPYINGSCLICAPNSSIILLLRYMQKHRETFDIVYRTSEKHKELAKKCIISTLQSVRQEDGNYMIKIHFITKRDDCTEPE